MTMLRHQNGHPLRTFDGMVNRVFSDLLASDPSASRPPVAPPLDLWELEDAWIVELDVPGCRLEELHLSIQDGILSVRGERNLRAEEGAQCRRQERRYGHYLREISLPGETDAEAVEATLDAGVLRVRLPKAPESRPQRIEVRSPNLLS